eukprot:9486493-Pyramimonas_sp.AAC.1
MEGEFRWTSQEPTKLLAKSAIRRPQAGRGLAWVRTRHHSAQAPRMPRKRGTVAQFPAPQEARQETG